MNVLIDNVKQFFVMIRFFLIKFIRMIEVKYVIDVLYGGVDFILFGNGGKECVEFLFLGQRVVEIVVYEFFIILVFWKMLGKVFVLEDLLVYREGSGVGKRFFLVVYCFVFGIEIGFKFVIKQVIFFFNFCYVIIVIQVRFVFCCYLFFCIFLDGKIMNRIDCNLLMDFKKDLSILIFLVKIVV